VKTERIYVARDKRGVFVLDGEKCGKLFSLYIHARSVNRELLWAR